MESIDLEAVKGYLAKAGDSELDELIKAAIRRFHVLYPEWEAVFFTMPRKHGEERNREIEKVMAHLRKWTE